MKNTLTSRTYVDKDVFVGIDVHKKTYSVVARVDKEIVKKWTTAASPEALAKQLLKYFPGAKIHTAYEAGFSAFSLHRELIKHKIDSIVIHAAAIEVAANDRVKTDKRDAKKLATLLETGQLQIKAVRVPSKEEEQRRMLTRTREQLVKDRTAVKNRIRMKFHQLGLIGYDDERQITFRLYEELLKRSPSEDFTMSVEVYRRIWKLIDEQIREIDKVLEKEAKQDNNEATYRSVPGFGKLSTRIFSNELGNMSQFQNEQQLFCFLGLTPSEHSSGESVQKGRISKQGSSRLRGLLVEVSWRAIREDRDLANFYNRLVPRTGKKRAIVAVARKLIGRIRAAFQKGEIYQVDYLTAAATVG